MDGKIANIIILAGQSNAVGVGTVEYLPNNYGRDEVEQFTRGYEKVQIDYTSHDMKSNGFVNTSIRCTERTRDTFGPEVGMARKLAQMYPNDEFFIVKCAFGGSDMNSNWRSPASGVPFCEEMVPDVEHAIHDPALWFPGWCYNALIRQLRESIERLKSKGYEPRIKAFCWMQGESDSAEDHCADPYIERYDGLLRDLQAAFPAYFSEDTTFVDAGISEIWDNYQRMNARKKAYAQEKGYRFIDTIAAGLTTKNEPFEAPDIYHYDCTSTIQLGELFVEEIFK